MSERTPSTWLPQPQRVERAGTDRGFWGGSTVREWFDVGFVSDHVDGDGNRSWFAAYKPVASVTGMNTRILAGPKTGVLRHGIPTREDAVLWLHHPEREVEARRAHRSAPTTRKRR